MTRLSILVPLLFVLAQAGWQPKPEVVREAARQQPQFNYEEDKVGTYQVPDVLGGGATRVKGRGEWPRRRSEILELFRAHVYGRSPGRPGRVSFQVLEEQPQAMGGASTLKRVSIVSAQGGREHRFELTMFLPNARRGRVPVFLLINNRPPSNTDPTRRERSAFWPAEELVARGYGIAAIQTSALAPDDKDHFREAVIHLFEAGSTGPRPDTAWAALAAWAWGASRAMDYLATDARVDARRVAVVGHSRGGKAALWAGAEDERFALVVSNDSGEGGAALTRRHFGETLARVTSAFPHWFAARYASYANRVDALPVDQHMLLALIAPRALYVSSADQDLWADPRGEFLSLVHASPVFGLWGEKAIAAADMPPLDRPLVVGRRGYHVRTGGHDLTAYDWQRFMDFAGTLWKEP